MINQSLPPYDFSGSVVTSRMEDSAFKKLSIKSIYKIRDQNDEKIKVGPHPHSCAKEQGNIVPKSHSLQAAIEDIENASGTVKSWKSREDLNPSWHTVFERVYRWANS